MPSANKLASYLVIKDILLGRSKIEHLSATPKEEKDMSVGSFISATNLSSKGLTTLTSATTVLTGQLKSMVAFNFTSSSRYSYPPTLH